MELNSDWAIAKAKENIDAWFPVVAVIEHFEESMAVLEHKLPEYFKGISKIYSPKGRAYFKCFKNDKLN